jgi:signal transduction histidine kinase
LLALQVRQLTESIRQLEEARLRAEHAQQAQSAFLAHLGHDFRTPLSAIIGFSDILTEEVASDSREFPILIRKSAERMMETFTALMDQARLDEEDLELTLVPLDVCHELVELIGMFGPLAAQKGIYLTHVLPADCPVWVRLDWMPFNRVLMNLISNAIKFTNEGGVTVTVRALDTMVEIEVRDTGIGIGEEFLPYIFDAFKQEERTVTFEGSGLGMAIARRLVTMMNGTIHVDSRKGEGSTFTVRFAGLPGEEAIPMQHPAGDGSSS